MSNNTLLSQHHGQHRPRRAVAGHGYDSDIGYRSDVAGYSSNRSVQHHTVLYPNPSFILQILQQETTAHLQGAANKSNPLPCFVNISTTNRNF